VAEVVESFPLTDREELPALAARTVMTAAELDARYSWKPEQALHVLVVRGFRVPEVDLEVLPKYGGCRSWVNLEPELEPAALESCTDSDRLAAELEAVREIVGG